MKKPIGILLTNTGTPDSPSVTDVKSYLASFLSDPRVVRLPHLLWKPLLHTIILRLRSPYSAKLYQKIWTEKGSPLRTTMLELAASLEKYLTIELNHPIFIEVGMHYGNPSIPVSLAKLQAKNIERLIVLPLFPQYSTSTTETARDQVQGFLIQSKALKPIFITDYAEHPDYITALVQQIKKYHHKNHYLLFSFHGIPQCFAAQGDPYPLRCQKTAALVAEVLQLSPNNWSIAYQSRFGYAKWLSPYTFEVLQQLPQRGMHAVSVICPGFSVDCLETLEEIKIRGKEVFIEQGGEIFQYIPALNAEPSHIEALAKLLKGFVA